MDQEPTYLVPTTCDSVTDPCILTQFKTYFSFFLCLSLNSTIFTVTVLLSFSNAGYGFPCYQKCFHKASFLIHFFLQFISYRQPFNCFGSGLAPEIHGHLHSNVKFSFFKEKQNPFFKECLFKVFWSCVGPKGFCNFMSICIANSLWLLYRSKFEAF